MYTNFPEPDYPAALGKISHLSSDELKDILNDDSKFEELMKDVKQFKDLETEKEMTIASNRSLAEFNLAREPQLVEGKQHLLESSAKGEALCRSVENKISELKSKSGNLSLETTHALLQTSAAESEEESEGIAEKFLSGDIDLEEFLEQFSSRRKLMHLRRVKADKMGELLAERSRSSNPAFRNSITTSPLNVPHYGAYYSGPAPGNFALPPVAGSSAATPYPVGGINMPMPGAYRANVY